MLHDADVSLIARAHQYVMCVVQLSLYTCARGLKQIETDKLNKHSACSKPFAPIMENGLKHDFCVH